MAGTWVCPPPPPPPNNDQKHFNLSMVPNLIEHIKRVYFYRFPLIKLHLVRQYTRLKHIFCEDSMLKTRFHGAALFFHSTIQLGLSDHINTETKLRPLPQYSFQSIKEIVVMIIQGLRRDQKSRGGGKLYHEYMNLP